MKYRDTSEARKLIATCGEYGQLSGEIGQGTAHMDSLKGGKGGSRPLSYSYIGPSSGIDPSKEFLRRENYKEALKYRRHLEDFPGFEKPKHEAQANGQRTNKEKNFVRDSHYNSNS